MANLASNYMEKGFLDDAKEILEKARKQPNYNKNIDSNLTRMHEIIDGENASEKKILSSIKDEKAFLVNFAEAYSLPRKAKIDGKWKSKHGEMKIVVNGNEIEGNGEITVRGGGKLSCCPFRITRYRYGQNCK